MEFRMLGPLEVWRDGASVPLGDAQQRFILVVLLLHVNKPVSTGRLTDIVWGGDSVRSPLVRGYINRLRNLFSDAADVDIVTTPTGYLLQVGEDQLDTHRFDRLRAEAMRTTNQHRAIELLREAVALWRGRFLEDIDIDRVGGPEVISPDDSYADTVGDLAGLELEAGDHRSARDRLRPLVQVDPASQRHAELLMRALLADGDRVTASRVFITTRNALAELGIEPELMLRNVAAHADLDEQLRTHAGFVSDVAGGPDWLGITGEVNTLCDVILAKEVSPPLSVGLFGDWGTGKSFFMGHMRERIDQLAAASRQAGLEGNDSALCANICQIEFNAWHYLDTDLWASLATTVFDRLAAADPTVFSGEVLRDLPSVRRERADLEERRKRTTQLLDTTNEELTEQNSIGVHDVLTTGQLATLLDVDTVASRVDDALVAAGVAADKVRQLDLRSMMDSPGSLSGNLLFVFQRTRWTVRLVILVVVLLFVSGPVVVTALLQDRLGWLTTSISSIVAFGVAALLIARPYLDRANRAVEIARSVVDSVDERQRAPLEARRDSLRRRMVDIEQDILRLDTHIQELNNANSVSAFAAERYRDDRYRRHEGMVATLRRDLEELSRRLTAGNREQSVDLERIVLYIDDLDRCPADRVVEVLQAIHLLLAFPLFVVVVGVDSRWLLRSLDQFLRTTDRGGDDQHWPSTPQNYLEKIFQISLCLRPMPAAGYASLVEATLGRMQETAFSSAQRATVDSIARATPAPTSQTQEHSSMMIASQNSSPTVVAARRLYCHTGRSATAYLEFDHTHPLLTIVDIAGTVTRRDLRGGLPILTKTMVDTELSAVWPVSGGRLLLVGPFGERAAVLVDLAHGRVAHEIVTASPGPMTAVVSPDSDDLILYLHDDSSTIYQTRTYWTEHVLNDQGTPSDTEVLALSRDWRVEHTGTQTIVLNGRAEKLVVPGPRPTVTSLDPTGERLALVDANGVVRIWHLSDPTVPREIPTLASAVHFGPRSLLATTNDKHVAVWDALSGHLRAELTVDEPVTALAFTADGRRLATGTSSGTVEVWVLHTPHTDPNLTASALRISAEEQATIVALQPLISTPRLAKRLINTYRLLRASLTPDELERIRVGEHKIVLLLLALLLSKPEQAHILLRALTSNTPQPSKFTTMVRRNTSIDRPTRSAASGRRLTPSPGSFETTLNQIIADVQAADDTESYRNWASVVSRYSFRLLEA